MCEYYVHLPQVYVSGTLELTECTSVSGGGVYMKDASLVVNGTLQFEGCRAETDGGCLLVLEGQIVQTGGTIVFLDRNIRCLEMVRSLRMVHYT